LILSARAGRYEARAVERTQIIADLNVFLDAVGKTGEKQGQTTN
jgi:hypothetical protein